MVKNASEVLEDALSLPQHERADLIDSLILSLDPGLEAAWDKELLERLSEYDSGAVKGTPWSDVRSKLASHRRDAI